MRRAGEPWTSQRKSKEQTPSGSRRTAGRPLGWRMSEERPENVTDGGAYEPPWRRTVVRRIRTSCGTERNGCVTTSPPVALTGDYWPSLGSHTYPGGTGHDVDDLWVLHSQALTAMKQKTVQRRGLMDGLSVSVLLLRERRL